MPLSCNEIEHRAIAFAKDWACARAGAAGERAQAQPFWIGLFAVFGVSPKRLASFEHAVKQHGGAQGGVDLFWPGVLIAEHQSRGGSLDRAFGQALACLPGLAERDRPRYVLVSDFARLRLTDLLGGDEVEFPLADLHKHLRRFAFIAGGQARAVEPPDPVNLQAAEHMGRLHDALQARGYGQASGPQGEPPGHPLQVLLMRLLFCLFAGDSGIFQPAQAFRAWVEERSAADGSDLGPQLAALFQVLNTPQDERSSGLDAQLAAFPCVDAALFAQALPPAAFDAAMREQLLQACAIDWSAISPAIFGALLQNIMDAKARRNLGAHYTSEHNILKLIGPLFLDALWAEFHQVQAHRHRLFEFHQKLRALKLLDPACGCGNFLVVAYRELRALELEVLRAACAGGQPMLEVHQPLALDLGQLYGIEIEAFPAQIAQVALRLIDQQMNLRASAEFGPCFARLAPQATPHIVHGNALRLDWAEVLPPDRCAYVLGNPPFVGKHCQSPAQKAELLQVFGHMQAASDLDYVSAWYLKAARYLQGTTVRCALVATNSITQGEQVPLLWPLLLGRCGIKLHFAHRTFQWSNEARGVAAVHCVIIGFGAFDIAGRTIFEYEDPKARPCAVRGGNIGPYLRFAPDGVIEKRQRPWAAAPVMTCGSKPSDGGHLILDRAERDALLAQSPLAAACVRRYVGSQELLNGGDRWCLWLEGVAPDTLRTLRAMPEVMKRLEAVRAFRAASSAQPTRRAAATPHRFFFAAQPSTEYIAIPEVSSERRRYVPIGLLPPQTIASNKLYLLATGSRCLLGLLQSAMHMAWVRTVAGRLQSRIQYSATMVYNTFPWPEAPGDAQRKAVEAAAQAVLDARAQFPGATLADLYDPLTMPPLLLKAHHELDAAVDAAYGTKAGALESDAARVAFLFERYQALASVLPARLARCAPGTSRGAG